MKSVLSSIIILLIAVPAFSSEITVILQPNYEIQMLSSPVLQDYYDRDMVTHFGGTVIVRYNRLNAGLFVQYLRYDFDVVDVMSTGGREEISGSRLTVGLQKDVRLKKNRLYGRLGLTKYFDDLAFAHSEDNRLGIHGSVGFSFKPSHYFTAFVETSYDYESVSVIEYRTVQYTRHNMYLSGKTFETGGISIQAGVSLPIVR